MPGAVLGVLVGAAIGLILVRYFGRADTRKFELEQLRPQALVVTGWRDKRFLTSLRRVTPLAPEVPYLFTASFDSEGLSIWTGGGPARRRVALIPTGSIAGVRQTQLESVGYRAPAFTRIAVEVLGEDAVEEVQFGVETIGRFGTSQPADEAQIAELVRQAAEALRLKPTVERQPPSTSHVIVPGTTAWDMARLAKRITTVLVIVGLMAVGVLFYLLLQHRVGVVPFAVAVFLFQGSYLLTFFASSRAARRERAAGYTTLNRVDLDLPQLHPRTGLVIREAGAPALSNAVFDDLVR